MSLTGVPLIVVAVLATGMAAAGTVALWSRGGRARIPLRAATLLLTEVLLLLGVGLVVNRSERFYPTWAALSQSVRTSGTTYAVAPGGLDGWVRANGTTFSWQPPGWTGWHLAGVPTVVVPAGYLAHPRWRYSAVLVLDGDATPPAPDTVAVYARTTAATGVDTLARAIPAVLGHDLRVTGRRWALVAAASATVLGRRVVAAAPDRFPAIATVPGTGRYPPVPRVRLPAGVSARVMGPLPDALTWACAQTPPPLAASTPTVGRLPVQHRHPHPHPGDSHGPGQRRH
ncbi:hypothetical protein [Actinoplanes sp. L3-i22]|uniref:hypothetical protein n=1 Tax=Actinoplanes sp. L3-i22 TaxID=2836373 RepID=UPI001C758D53|nr:hypothetical protein [Actinoplanes sp. L3-i22]BCY11453.1 hypothetical protein L3i22_065410 [Actinoplanes sp. L3-i22]